MKITICGSIGFYKDMEAARDQLMKQGHEVKIPELALEVPKEFGGGKKVYFGQYIEQNGGIDSFDPSHRIWDLKHSAINDHFEKIDLNPVSSELSYKQEIIGMKPVMLSGDLSALK